MWNGACVCLKLCFVQCLIIIIVTGFKVCLLLKKLQSKCQVFFFFFTAPTIQLKYNSPDISSEMEGSCRQQSECRVGFLDERWKLHFKAIITAWIQWVIKMLLQLSSQWYIWGKSKVLVDLNYMLQVRSGLLLFAYLLFMVVGLKIK